MSDTILTKEDSVAVVLAYLKCELASGRRDRNDETEVCVLGAGVHLVVRADPNSVDPDSTVWRVILRKKGSLNLYTHSYKGNPTPFEVITYLAGVMTAEPTEGGNIELPKVEVRHV